MIRKALAALALLVTAAGCAYAQDRPPADVPADWKRIIGDYTAGDSVLYVYESDGRLRVRTGLFTSHLLEEFIPDVAAAAAMPVQALLLDGRRFTRRNVAEGTFRIRPVRPVEELRKIALAAPPPPQPDTLLRPELVELRSLDSSIRYDIRYATTNNFMNAVFYTQPRAFLQRPAAEAVVRAHQKLRQWGYGLLIHDAYRPWYVTKMFWDATPDSLRHFVADPRSGSRHNRGAAVDLTLYDLQTGEPVEMPGGYDEFSPRSYAQYPGGTERQRWHRDLLRRVMEAEGFRVYPFEWWHFDYQEWRRYPVLNKRFEAL